MSPPERDDAPLPSETREPEAARASTVGTGTGLAVGCIVLVTLFILAAVVARRFGVW